MFFIKNSLYYTKCDYCGKITPLKTLRQYTAFKRGGAYKKIKSRSGKNIDVCVQCMKKAGALPPKYSDNVFV